LKWDFSPTEEYKNSIWLLEFQRTIEEKLSRNYTAEIIVLYISATIN